MSFTSFDFLVWLGLLALLYKLCPVRGRALFVVLVSYLYYLSGGLTATSLLISVSLFTYGAGLWLDLQRRRKTAGLILGTSVILLVFYLLLFKIQAVVHPHGAAAWIMPLGLSYYSFKLIGYLLDVYWQKIPAQAQLLEFLAFVAFFPQIVAGPIQRAQDYFGQTGTQGPLLLALSRIGLGLAKKLIIADHLAPAVAYVYVHTGNSHAPLWIGFYVWPLQLYADFSGLTDIAIGSGLLFGIRGPENFERPFTASNIADYWRRWHMSLTKWLVDYLFTPLRMATRTAGNVGLVVSISINMIAIGLWHGLSWCYLAFGVLHSVFMSIAALTSRLRKSWFKRHPRFDRAGSWLGWLVTFHCVALALVFFRASSVESALALLRNMLFGLWHGTAGFSVVDSPLVDTFFLGMGGYLVLELCERYRPDRWLTKLEQSESRWLRWSAYGSRVALLLFGMALIAARGGGIKDPFVYAIF